jgi:hypothetical protein
MATVTFDIETALEPDKVVSLLTDFSDHRPALWPGLWEGAYEVYDLGDTSADVREGNKSPKVWAREHYDWSQPGTVRWEVVESNFCKPGSFVEVHVREREAGGSRLEVVWSRSPSSIQGVLAAVVVKLTKGRPVKASISAGLEKAEHPAPAA